MECQAVGVLDGDAQDRERIYVLLPTPLSFECRMAPEGEIREVDLTERREECALKVEPNGSYKPGEVYVSDGDFEGGQCRMADNPVFP